MKLAPFLTAIIVGIVVVDTFTVTFANAEGMRYPFLAAAIVNVIIAVGGQMAMIVMIAIRSFRS
jgi:branched-subunit amino acid transport protein